MPNITIFKTGLVIPAAAVSPIQASTGVTSADELEAHIKDYLKSRAVVGEIQATEQLERVKVQTAEAALEKAEADKATALAATKAAKEAEITLT